MRNVGQPPHLTDHRHLPTNHISAPPNQKQGLGFAASLSPSLSVSHPDSWRSWAASGCISYRHQIIRSALRGLSAPAGTNNAHTHRRFIHPSSPENTPLSPPPSRMLWWLLYMQSVQTVQWSAFDALQNPDENSTIRVKAPPYLLDYLHLVVKQHHRD